MSSNGNNLRRFGQYEIDLEKKILWVNHAPADLPVKAVEVLCALVESGGNVVSKDELLEKVWADSFVEEGVLPQNVYLLRKIFKENGLGDDLIQTVPRRGYRFIGKLEETNGHGDIIFERETLEHEFIAEFEELDLIETSQQPIEVRTIQTAPKTNRRPIYYALGMVVALLVALVVVPPIYRNYFQTNSTNSNNSNLEYERLSDSSRVYHMGMSPNDKHVAYTVTNADGKNSLVLHHLPTGSETVVVKPQDLAFNSIQFSPDGNYIYYLARQDTTHIGVYRIPLYGGQPQLITKDLIDYFSVSPDGEWLAFYRWEEEKGGYYLDICRSRDGSEQRTVTERKDKDSFRIWGVSPAWSPDGKKLVSSALSKDVDSDEARNFLIETDIETGAQTRVSSPEWYRISQSRWQPDGKGLFVLASEKKGEPLQIWHLDYPSGAARNLTDDNNAYRLFHASSDMSFITAISWVRTVNLFLIPLDNPSQIRQLTHDTATINGAFGVKWTNDGKEILYGNGKSAELGNVFKINPETLEITQLTHDSGSRVEYVDTTPDGKSVVFASNRTGFWNIWQVDLDGTNLRAITNGKNEHMPEVSPDGKWLYYVSDGLWKMPISGGEVVKVWNETPQTTRVSPTDPKHLISYYHDKNEKVKNAWMFVAYNEDNPSEYKNLGIGAVVQFEWKHDGSGIYYADPNEAFNNLWFLSLKDLKSQKVTNYTDQRIVAMSLSPDGKTMVVARGTQNANIVKITGWSDSK